MPPFTVGVVIAVVVLLIAILGLLGIVPVSGPVVFGSLAALSIARLT